MQSDDQFRLAFDTATTRLAAWAEQQRDAAAVQTETMGPSWRLSLVPTAVNACPVEVILHRETQSFDIQLGPETSEGHRIETFDLLHDILAAAVDGRIVTQQLSSVVAGSMLAVETRVRLNSGSSWSSRRLTNIGAQRPTHDALVRERHWLAYRR